MAAILTAIERRNLDDARETLSDVVARVESAASMIELRVNGTAPGPGVDRRQLYELRQYLSAAAGALQSADRHLQTVLSQGQA